MPRKAKEELNEVKEKIVKKEPSSKKTSSKKDASETTKKVKKETTKKSPSKTSKKKETTKSTKTSKAASKKSSTSKKSTEKVDSKDVKVKKVSTKKSTTTKKTTTKVKQNKKKVEIVEYYDLPYRYNQTIVKVLAQTPNTLFVYWDISDDDRKKYIEQYGEYFFNNTKPVLIVHNKTKNYNFEVDINDFANSWYLRLIDSNCDYQIELGRRPINEYVHISNNYLYVTNSNEIESPNDHILFDKLSHFVYFKNVKTNETIKKHTNLTLLSKIGKISSVQEFYKKLYPDEAINFDRLDLNNPSSNNPTSSFK